MQTSRTALWLSLWLVAGCLDSGAPCRPGTICTIAGSGENGYDEAADERGILARKAMMSIPQDILTASDGALYILDWNNHRLRRLDPDGKIRWVAGSGELGGSPDDPPSGALLHPASMTFDPSGEAIIISGWHDSKVWSLDLESRTLTRIAGDGRRTYEGDGGPALESAMDLPASVAFAPGGDLVVMDQVNQLLRAIGPDGTIRRLAGQCIIDLTPTGREPCDEPTSCPESDKLTCGDPAETCFGPCSPSYAGDGGPATQMRMAQPVGASAFPSGRIAFDAEGNLYFADTQNHLIRMIDSEGIVHRIAGRAPVDGVPQSGYAGDGGEAKEALLDGPVDLALADDGTLYFTEVYNHCVRAIDAEGTITTVAGQCGVEGYEGDGGPAAEALLKLPFGLEWVDGALNIADSGNHVIRRVVLGADGG